MAGKYKVDFAAEIKQVSSRKLASLDIEYKVVLITNDPAVLNLGALDPDILVNVRVGTQDASSY